MPVQYLVIAGPQAAGKSTIMRNLCTQASSMIPLEESRQIIVHKYQRLGAIYMTAEDEIEVIHQDMTRMFAIIGKGVEIGSFLDETNVFTLGHAKAHGIDLLQGYFKQYCDMLARLRSAILFVDVPPNVSWNRRRHRYSQRLWSLSTNERDNIMAKYKTYLERLHPELLAIFDRLTLPKVKMEGVGTEEEVCLAATKAFCELQRHF